MEIALYETASRRASPSTIPTFSKGGPLPHVV